MTRGDEYGGFVAASALGAVVSKRAGDVRWVHDDDARILDATDGGGCQHLVVRALSRRFEFGVGFAFFVLSFDLFFRHHQLLAPRTASDDYVDDRKEEADHGGLLRD